MELILTQAAITGAIVIFGLRVVDMSLDTLRMLMVMRGRRGLAWVLGFFQSAVFVIAISSVLSQMNNLLNVIAYAAGFATGNVVGMWLEERLAIGHSDVRIISSRRGSAIADKLREAGYAVTVIPARGRDGMVTLLNASVLRRNVEKVHQLVNDTDAEAFITVEDVRPVRRGFWRS